MTRELQIDRADLRVRPLCLALALAFAAAALAETGADSCKPCHEQQWTRQSATHHARSLAPPARHALAAKFPTLPFQPDWAFGGGKQAVTFVSRARPGVYLEHSLSYYTSLAKLGPTPGHQGLAGPGVQYPVLSAGAAILRCFQCHSTGVPVISPDLDIAPAEPGVRCESCHGPGDEHAKAPAAANIVNPARYSASELNQLCGSCHRKPAPTGSATDWSDPWNTRHQPLYLAESRCFQASAGKLSCRTCHDPHSGETRDGCAACHAKPRHAASTRVAGRTCVSCHMPNAAPMPGLRFANHWIGVYPPGNVLKPRQRALQ